MPYSGLLATAVDYEDLLSFLASLLNLYDFEQNQIKTVLR